MKLTPKVRQTAKTHPLCIVYCVGMFFLGIFVQGWVPGA